MLLILRLPADSAIYPVSQKWGRWGNETYVCRGAFWIIWLLPDGKWKDQKIKIAFLFLFLPSLFTYPSSFPSTPPDVKMSRSCFLLIFSSSMSGFNLWLNPHLVTVRIHTQKYAIRVKQKHSFLRDCSPMTFYSLISSYWPLNSWGEALKGSKFPQQVDSGDKQVWLPDIRPTFTLLCLHTGSRHYLDLQEHRHTSKKLFAAR